MSRDRMTRFDWEVSLDAIVTAINLWEERGDVLPNDIESARKTVRWIIDNKLTSK